jgi:predicted GNAT family acetyltransferase
VNAVANPPVVNNSAENRFETTIAGYRAELLYHRNGERLVLAHTEVPEALAGRGVGGALVRAAIDEAERHGFTVVPGCSFARSWLRGHPEEAARVAIDWPDD